MLLWEALSMPAGSGDQLPPGDIDSPKRTHRLPFDKRCAAITKSGRRCRGRIRQGTDWCVFHDPHLTAERRRRIAANGGRRHHRLSHLPDGYLRKLTSRRAVGEAMDRLYREIRLGFITPEMGRVLFDVLNRILDSGLADTVAAPRAVHRTRAERVRPKLCELLTRAERAAWRKAVADAPGTVLRGRHEPPPGRGTQPPDRKAAPAKEAVDRPVPLPLQAAS